MTGERIEAQLRFVLQISDRPPKTISNILQPNHDKGKFLGRGC